MGPENSAMIFYTLLFLFLLFAGWGIYMARSHRKNKGKTADTGTRIKTDILLEKAVAEKTEKAITAIDKREEIKKAVRKPAVSKAAAGAGTAKAENFPRIIYNYFPMASMEEGELWVCRNCEVENGADHDVCFLCGASRPEADLPLF